MKDKARVYLDNAATTRVRQEVWDSMRLALCEEYGNPSSVHTEGQRAKRLLEEARRSIASNLNCSAPEIYFTSGGTESDNCAIRGIAWANRKEKKHIITSSIEHPAVLKTCRVLEEEGFRITYLPVDTTGRVSPMSLAKALTPDTCLVSIMLGNNEIGTIEPIPELVRIAHEHGTFFHTDAVQAVGTIPVDVSSLQVDLLSLSAHKFHGPKGVGALFVRNGVKICSLLQGGAQENQHRAGTENLPGILGMAKALQLSCEEMKMVSDRILALREMLVRGISDICPHVVFHGNSVDHLPGIVNCSFPGQDGEKLLLLLNYHGFACSGGAACSSQNAAISHVLTAIGVPEKEAGSSLRISIGSENTEEEIRSFLACLRQLIN